MLLTAMITHGKHERIKYGTAVDQENYGNGTAKNKEILPWDQI